MTRDEALAALSVLGAGELLLARATSGALPAADVVAALAGWAVVGGLAWVLPRRFVVTGAAAAIALHVAAAPAWTAGGTAALVLASIAAVALVASREVRGVPLAAGTLVTATLVAVLAGPPPRPSPLLEALLGVAAAAFVAERLHWAPVLPVAAMAATVPRWPLRSEDPRPDVLVVTVDALRADTATKMEAFREVAAAGRAYEAWATAPWTLPSLASLWTGLPANAHGAGRAPGGGFSPVDPSLPTLADRLRAAGWDTVAMSGGNPFTGQRYGLARPFDEVHHPWEPVAAPIPRLRSPHLPARPLFARVLPRPSAAWDADALVDAAIRRLAEHDRPRLLWLHLMDLHLPYASPPCRPEVLGAPGARTALLSDPWWSSDEGRACLRSAYAAAAARVDAALRRLLAAVDRTRTVIVLTADHGEALGDAGFEHGHTLEPEVTRIPLVISAPGELLPEIPGPVSLQDVAVTVLSLVGLPPDLPGLDLTLPGSAGPTALSGVLYGPPQRGVVDDTWLLVEGPDGLRLFRWGEPAGAREVDPAAEAAVVERLRTWLPKVERVGPGVEGDAGRLREMGYVE